jgi:ferredoxin
MGADGGRLFEAFLNQQDEEAWQRALAQLEPHIHEVDRTATRIWFHFFPLALARALQEAEDPAALARQLFLEGKYRLADQMDSSHRFLYGHRYWPEVKRALIAYAHRTRAPERMDLADHIREVAAVVAEERRLEPSLTLGITAVAFMTVEQVGLEAFRATPGTIALDPRTLARTPDEVLARRARDDRQSLFYWWKYPDKVWTITFDENDPEATFRLINRQHLTTAAAQDKRPHHLRDPRCVPHEGPIPVQCRSGSCGSCWVGILGGAEKLSEMEEYERRRLREFGYIETDEPKPIIRLACQARAFGAVSIVIPPWNGVFGRFLRKWRQQQRPMELMGTP